MREHSTDQEPENARIDADYDIDDGQMEDPVAIASAITELKTRADAGKIEYEEGISLEGEPFFVLLLPAGREKRRVPAYSLSRMQALLGMRFEKYSCLGPYEALCSYSDSSIEASVRGLGRPISSRRLLHLFQGRTMAEESINNEPIVVEDPSGSGLVISIGHVSDDLATLTMGRHGLSLRIANAPVVRHDQALSLLSKVANSLFFEIELRYNLALSLQRARVPYRSVRRKGELSSPGEIQFPRSEYDSEPMSLYWYARSATGMPLLQYLAYYQILEFYFPVYAQRETHHRVKNILRSPSFDPHSDADIGRILSVFQQSHGSFGNERSQLKSTIQSCVNEQELFAFVLEDDERKEFLSKEKVLQAHRLPISNKEADIRAEVASRIYDIRCKIVHTKNEDAVDDMALLLPFSKEAEALHSDIDLIRYVAREVLIANSRSFRG